MIDKLFYENKYKLLGYSAIAGMDEVGRGPLAGPVVAACVILNFDDIIDGIDDSKKVSAKKRESLLVEILAQSVSYGIGIVDEKIIDEINILQATYLAMEKAVQDMKVQPDIVLCDAVKTLKIEQEVVGITKGDSLSYLIGAASIIAKQKRDHMMIEYAITYPEYGFEQHKGYGTKQHRQALLTHGPCAIHRRSFIKKIWTVSNE
ncbi:MAG: ribonuclease HII [Clostridiales bacterium]|nr:ribonuclease HII [Clostridiales bacterium]